MSTHPCPVPGCTATLPFRILMCRAHWRQVPRALQLRVYATWNDAHPTSDYLAVRQEAIDAVVAGSEQREEVLRDD